MLKYTEQYKQEKNVTDKRKKSQEELEEIARRRDVNEYTGVCLVAMVLIVLMAVASTFVAG